jgi:pyruvate dehydrogenase E2 component (dihydrolipoamide acetyltransferase)
MAIAIEMPKMSDTMQEGVLVAWLKEEGSPVAPGDIIAQVETDKATMDLEAYDKGVLLRKVAQEGEAVPIGALIAVLGKAGEDIAGVLAKYGKGSGDGSAAAPATASAETAAPVVKPVPAAPGEDRVKSSPLARRLAQEHGLSLATIQGSGPEGRIVKRDIEAALTGTGNAPAPVVVPALPAPVPVPTAPVPPPAPAASGMAAPSGAAPYEAIRLSQMRKAIARRLSESKFTAPHFYLTVDVAMEQAVAFRQQLNELAATQGRAKVSFNDFITKACALALRQHPWVNASWMEKEGEMHKHHEVHVAVAVAIEDGLITPVIRHADRKGLAQIAEETQHLAERARNKQLQPEDYTGSTFTTSNLGMFGIEEFTAIINPPNACILAIGAIRDVPVVQDGAVVPGKRMKLTLSCDHRIVDGATGAQFLGTVRQYLEHPLNLML